jgi:VCBS repeat protein
VALRRALTTAVAAAASLVLVSPASASVSFAPVPGSPFGIQFNQNYNPFPSSIVSGDLNGDGHTDIVSADSHPNNCLSVMLGTGEGALELAHVYDGYATPQLCDGTGAHQALAGADFNGDGKLDLADADGNEVILDTGNGDGSFTLKGASGAFGGTSGVLTADLNKDGKQDLIEAGEGYDNSSGEDLEWVDAQLGNGDGTFQAPAGQTVDNGYQTPAIGVADFTGDGIPDVIAATTGERPATGKLVLLPGKGDGTFAAPVQIAANGGKTLVVADFNGDGHPDVAVGEPTEWVSATPAVRLYLGDGHGGFTEAASPLALAVQQQGAALSAADFDGDGKVDLAVALPGEEPETGEPITTVSVLFGNGDGSFQPVRSFESGVQVTMVSSFDLDGDSHPDLIVGGRDVVNGTPGKIAVLRDVAATPPLATTGSASGVGTSAAVLNGSVNPQGESTTYSFQYGPTASYGSSTAAASAGADSTEHAVAASLGGLAPYTTYHFRVLASSGAGTAYGADQTFTTAALPAETQTGPPTGVSKTGATLTGSVAAHGAPTTFHFEYGTTTSYGSSTAEQSAGSGGAAAPVSSAVGGLAPGTVYHYRIVAHGPAGTVAGSDLVFYTPVSQPQPAESDTTFKKDLRLSSHTVLQRYLDVLVTCTEDCLATVNHLSIELVPGAGVGHLDSQHSLDTALEVGVSRKLSAGHRGKLRVSLPTEASSWIADVLRHGGMVRLTPDLNVVDPHGQGFDAITTMLHLGHAIKAHAKAARAHAAESGVVTVDDLGVRDHPRPHRWQITLSGRQTTTWHLNGDSTEGSCHIIYHGNGSQSIAFDGTETVTGYIWMSKAGVPLLTTTSGTTPFNVPLALTVERQGSLTSGISGECKAVASGDGQGHAPTPDCGKRKTSVFGTLEWLGPKDLHAGEDANSGLVSDALLYDDCPFFGTGLGGLYLNGADDKDFPPDLVLTRSAQRKISEPLRARYHQTLAGGEGYADTEVVWNVELLRVDCPASGSGGLKAACVDDKQKEEAAKAAQEYKKAEENAAGGIKAACKGTSAESVRETGIACIIMTVKDGYDGHMQGKNEAIANDPPDPDFRNVARAHVASLKLPASTPAAVRKLLGSEQRATALAGVLAKTINRANSALEAGNARALRRQNRAALADARRLAALFGAQPKLAKRARRALLAVVPASQRQLAGLLDTRADVKTARSMAALMKSFARQRL